MGLFRSEEMVQKKVRMPGNISAAMRIMDQMGNIEEDTLEFIDLTKDDIEAKKGFYPILDRCEEMEAKLQIFYKYSKEFSLPIQHYTSMNDMNQDLLKDQNSRGISINDYFDAVEAEIIDDEKKMIDLMESYNKIKEDLQIEIERKLVLEKYNEITGIAGDINNNEGDNNLNISISNGNLCRRDSINSEISKESSITAMLGVVKASEDLKMQRLIFRAGHNRIVSTFFDLIYPVDYRNTKAIGIEKKIFLIFYPNNDYFKNKLTAICNLFNCTMFSVPSNNRLQKTIKDSIKKTEDQKNYLNEAAKSIKNCLRNKFATESNRPGKYIMYQLYLKKEKMIYTNLSKCILKEHFIDGEIWVLASKYDQLKQSLSNHQDEILSVSATFIDLVDFGLKKPTYIPRNEFTYFFQQIINTYGIPRYGEINPGYFTIVTFPFLFGVMFGDIGHGLLLLLMASYLCIASNSIKADKTSILRNVIRYRYFLLLLGIFSVFCGFIYNDFLSIPLNLFGSCYAREDMNDYEAHKKYHECVYPFGLDPKWYVSSNQLAFFNSIKMKLSVIIGILQMTFGICLKGLNDLHFGLYMNFLFEFIPQLIFMSLLFGYMIIMIVFKWLKDYGENIHQAPNIVVLMVNIFLKNGSVEGMPLFTSKSSDGVYLQEQYQHISFIICLCMVPCMLFIKPIVQYFTSSSHSYKKDLSLLNNEEEGNDDLHMSSVFMSQQRNAEHSPMNIHRKGFLDYFIVQLIETIEFVLGSISNTASYLRLWALSLAHAELSIVFMEKTFLDSISGGDWLYGFNLINIFIGFFIFANITVLVLLFMDSMECALHTLRLHWVEFQDKFYKGDGIEFRPFSFKYLIQEDY